MYVVEIVFTHTHTHIYNILYIYILIQCAILYKNMDFCSCRLINLFNFLLYFTVVLNQVKHSMIYLFRSTKWN